MLKSISENLALKGIPFFLNIALKVCILCFLCFYFYKHVYLDNRLSDLISRFLDSFKILNLFLLIVIAGLTILNWGIESLKWQKIVKPIKRIGFKRSYKAVLSGVTIAMVTPNRIGEYGGRVAYIPSGKRVDAALATIAGSLSQIFVTNLAGLLAFLYFIPTLKVISPLFLMISYVGISLTFLLLLYIYARFPRLIQYIQKIRIIQKIKWINRALSVVHLFNKENWNDLLHLSALRYVVFAVQYLLLLTMFGAAVPFFDGIMMVAIIFFIQSSLPSPAIAELGLRNGLAIYFFGSLTSNTIGIMCAATAIWLVNMVIPATVGAVFMIRENIIKK